MGKSQIPAGVAVVVIVVVVLIIGFFFVKQLMPPSKVKLSPEQVQKMQQALGQHGKGSGAPAGAPTGAPSNP